MPNVQPIDFAATALAQYSGFYATVIDDFLTPAECQHLRDLAASTGKWKPAALGPTRSIHTSFRNSDQVLRIDMETADMIY
jgi:hypothetical protein